MDIVEELRQNRESGAKRLVSEYRAGLMSLARRFCQNESDAEELVNATFAKVVHNIDDYLEQSAFFAWMCQILTNLFRESVRRKSHQMEVYPGEVPDIAAADAQEAIYASLDASFLRDAIETLPQDLRRTIVMHYFMDMPVGEIAKVLSISPGTVKWRLHHARIAIAAKLGVAAKKPGGKAVLLALLLCGLTALGAAVWNLIAPGEATGPADSGKSQVASRLSSFAATEASGQATSDIRQSEAFDFRLSTFDLQPSNLSTSQPFNFSTDNSQGDNMNITAKTTAVLAAAIAATPAITSTAGTITWNTSCGQPVRWLESVSNWTPAQFPGATDTVVLGQSGASPADVCLANGDSVSVLNAEVACVANTTAKITVNSGASLTFNDANATNWFGNANPASSELDVDGGSVTFNGMAWFSDRGSGNTIRIRNGGTVDFGKDVVFGNNRIGYEGATKMYIGPGGIVRQNASGRFILGGGWLSGGDKGSGGEIEIDGGTFIAGNNLYFRCGPYGAQYGYYGHGEIRLKSGNFSFAGSDQNLHFFGQGALAGKFIQSGGNFAGNLSFQRGVPAESDNLIEISGGTNTCSSWKFGTSSGDNGGRMHMRIVGREGVVKVGTVSLHTPYNASSFTEPPILMEFVVDPTTRRDTDFPVTPVYVTVRGYNGGYREIRGVHHVRPAGGAQLVHRDTFPIYVKEHDGWASSYVEGSQESTDGSHGFWRYRFAADDQYQTIGAEMWTNVFDAVSKNEILGTTGYTWQFQQKLKAGAALADGAAALETPVVRGYLALPEIAVRDLRDMRFGRVRLAVTPGAGETLQSIVDGFKANGYPDSVVEADGIYNVSLVIPTERLVAGISTDKILFDFAEYPNYNAAKTKSPTIRATISAVKWDPRIDEPATVLYMR